jgi:Cobalamin biosynthesis protein CobT (nicotinate-mononucleotide:5, 6-dimethylbenzimidazole phosphoribosyltransferase)
MLVVYLAFLAIPLGDLFHVVVSFTEVLYLFFEYNIPLYGAEISLYSGIVGFVIPVLIGNTIGGIVLVTLVNYFQTSQERLEEARFEGVTRRLTVPEWVLGRAAGRSYVPILDATEATLFANEGYRIMVPITNPRTDGPIVELASQIASDHEDGLVHIVHVVQAPERMSLSAGAGRIADVSEEGMAGLRETAEEYDIDVSTSTVVSHRSFEEVFNMARRTRPDAVLMGWGEDQLWNAARAERPIDELTNQLPCDFLILNESDLDTSRVLLPTSGGPDSTLGAEVASVLSRTADAEVSLLHVVNGPENRTEGEGFLTAWAAENGLSDAERIVDDSGDVEGAIAREAADNTLVIIGATEKGLLSRLVSNSLHLDVIHDVDCSVLLAERPSNRSLRDRLFGPGRRVSGPPDGGVERDPDEASGAKIGDSGRRRDEESDDLASGDDDGTDDAGDVSNDGNAGDNGNGDDSDEGDEAADRSVITDHDDPEEEDDEGEADDSLSREPAVITDHDEPDEEEEDSEEADDEGDESETDDETRSA